MPWPLPLPPVLDSPLGAKPTPCPHVPYVTPSPVLQVTQPFDQECCNTLQSFTLLVQAATLWMALLWLDPLFAPGTAAQHVLVVLFMVLQGLLGCLFVAVAVRLLHFHVVDHVRSRTRNRGLQLRRAADNKGPAMSPHTPQEFVLSRYPRRPDGGRTACGAMGREICPQGRRGGAWTTQSQPLWELRDAA